jgi:hypothetical protein
MLPNLQRTILWAETSQAYRSIYYLHSCHFSIGVREKKFLYIGQTWKVIAINQVKKIFLNLDILTYEEIVFSTVFWNFLFLLSNLYVLTTNSKKKFWNFSLEVLFKNSLSSYLNFADYENFNKKNFWNFFFHHSLAKTCLLKYFQENFRIFLIFSLQYVNKTFKKFVTEKYPLR